MREYETTIVLRANLEEAELEKEIQAVESGITGRGGEIVHLDRWGKRRLAYEIDRQHEGYYVLFRYTASAEVPSELEKRFRINERLLRHLTVIADTPRPRPPEADAEPGQTEATVAEEGSGASETAREESVPLAHESES